MSDPREVLGQVNRLRASAEGAESLRRSFRLGAKASRVQGRVRVFGHGREQEVPLTNGEGDALYAALLVVHDLAVAQADALEATVQVTR